MAKPIYTDDAPKKRRKKYPRGKHPRPLNSESRDVKLLRLPFQQQITLTQAAQIMGIARTSLQHNYLYPMSYALPDYIEVVRDNNRIIGIKRVGP